MSAAIFTRRQLLAQGAASLGLDLSGTMLESLAAYVDLLVKWNRVYNLTAIRDPDEMLTQHLLDSLSVVNCLKVQRVLDVGSGPGLPGIVISLVRPDLRVSLLDSNQKKCAFMQQAVSELRIANAQVECCRVENLATRQSDPGVFDSITSRAFASLADFASASLRYLAPGGRLVAMKGKVPEDELHDLPDTVRLIEIRPLQVPGLTAARCAVILECISRD